MGPSNHQGRFRRSRFHPVCRAVSGLRYTLDPQHVTSRIVDNPSPTPSAAHKVFATEELLGMILTCLPPGPLRHAMQVSRDFRDAIDPEAAHPLTGMRVALGLRFGRKLEDMTPSEHADLALREDHYEAPTVFTYHYDIALHRRFHWLLNVNLHPVDHPIAREIRHVSVPTLAIAPFSLVRIARGDHAGRGNGHKVPKRSGDEDSNVLTMEFSLTAKGYDNAGMITNRGIFTAGTVYPNDDDASWSDIKILTMPFDVRVSVSVDFRDAMQARGHHIGHCRVPGCQVGDHGVQETSILFPAERATLANLITFLNGVEYFAIGNATLIHHDTQAYGIAEDRDWYYMGGGASEPPPILQPEWRGWWEGPGSQMT